MARQLEYDPQMDQTQTQSEPGMLDTVMNTVGKAGKWAYENLTPQTLRQTAEPIAEGAYRSVAIQPELIGAMIRGENSTPEQKQKLETDWNEYANRMQTVKENLNRRLFNTKTAPANYGGIAGEVIPAMMMSGGSSGLPVNFANALGLSGWKGWLAGHLLTGGLAGAAHGVSRPEDTTLKQRIGRGVTEAMVSAPIYTGASAVGEGLARLPKMLKDESTYLFGKQFNVLNQGENAAKSVDLQNKVSEELMNRTTGLKPETIAKQASEVSRGLTPLIEDQLKNIQTPVSDQDISEALSSSVADKIQGFSKANQDLTEEAARLDKIVYNNLTQNHDIGKVGVMPGQQGMFDSPLSSLFKAKQALGDDMAQNGVFKRLNSDSGASPMDRIALSKWSALKDLIDEKLQLSGGEGVAPLTELQHQLMEGGKAAIKSARGVSTNPTLFDLRRMPGLRLLLPYLQAGETGLLRNINDVGAMGSAVTENPYLRPLIDLLPGLYTQNKMPKASSNLIKVHRNDTGETGTIPEEEFDPSLYTRIE